MQTCKCGHCSPKSNGYCLDCHAMYMRGWRRTHQLTPEQRLKMNARCYANVYQRRGLLIKQPCEVCRSPHSQKHHEDYSQPLQVRWLCRACHLQQHKAAAVRPKRAQA